MGASELFALESRNIWDKYFCNTMKESDFFINSKKFDKDAWHFKFAKEINGIIVFKFVKDNNGIGFNVECVFSVQSLFVDFPEFQTTIISPDPDKETLKPSDMYHVLIRARFDLDNSLIWKFINILWKLINK